MLHFEEKQRLLSRKLLFRADSLLNQRENLRQLKHTVPKEKLNRLCKDIFRCTSILRVRTNRALSECQSDTGSDVSEEEKEELEEDALSILLIFIVLRSPWTFFQKVGNLVK